MPDSDQSPLASVTLLRRLIGHGIVFLLLGLLIAVLLRDWSERISPDWPRGRDRIVLLRQQQHDVEALALGNSQSQAIDFQALGLSGFHLWLEGTDPEEAAYTLRVFRPGLPRLKRIYFPLSLGYSRHIDSRNEGNRAVRNLVYYQTLCFDPWSPAMTGDWKNWLAAWFRPIARKDRWRAILTTGGGTSPDKASLANDGKYWTTGVNWRPPQPDARQRNLKAMSLIPYFNSCDAACRDQNWAHLLDFVFTASRLGLEVVLYTPPYSQTYIETIKQEAPEILAETRAWGQRLAREPGVRYYDFADYSPIGGNPAHFGDEVHLNPKGALLFSTLLAGFKTGNR